MSFTYNRLDKDDVAEAERYFSFRARGEMERQAVVAWLP